MPTSPMHPAPLVTIEAVPVALWGPMGSKLTIMVRFTNNHPTLHARFEDHGFNPPPAQYASSALIDILVVLEPGGCKLVPFAEITWNQNAPAGFVWEDLLNVVVTMHQQPDGPSVLQGASVFNRYVAIVSSPGA